MDTLEELKEKIAQKQCALKKLDREARQLRRDVKKLLVQIRGKQLRLPFFEEVG